MLSYHLSVFVETRCLASLFRGDPEHETRSIASLQWKQSLILSTFDKLIGGKALLCFLISIFPK
ncbi:MAG: hypothetical protein VSS75_021240 [Candidatus Parabeggiatoa sp.]